MATEARLVSRHRPTQAAALARGAIEAAAISAFVLMVLIWATVLTGRV